MPDINDLSFSAKLSLEELLNSWLSQPLPASPALAEKIVAAASKLLASGQADSLKPETIRDYLNVTSTATFLTGLPYPEKTGNGLRPVSSLFKELITAC